MRIGILSDVHSNLEALERALHVLSEKNTDEVICLGDTVGYGADPNACLDLVCKSASHVLLGNHDEAAIRPDARAFFNPMARAAAEWTSSVLTPEHAAYIAALPYRLERQDVLFVHSSPVDPEQWHYIITAGDAREALTGSTARVCFVGHSHIPGIYSAEGRVAALDRSGRYLINVGSVGQPRDGDPRLSCGIFDPDAWTYEHIRAEYDIAAAAEKIRAAHLPRALGDRLFLGR